jgi:uncharacterized protein involved in exopolysaccharide biosynthesis
MRHCASGETALRATAFITTHPESDPSGKGTGDTPGSEAPPRGAFSADLPIQADATDKGERSPLGGSSMVRLAGLLLLPIVLTALGAYAFAIQSERVHAARSEIVFDLRNVAWGAAERFLETQAVVARSRALLAPVADTFGIPVAELDRALAVEAVRGSDVIRLEYANTDPSLAQAVTKAITDRYLVALREYALLDGTRHRLLTPTFILDEPVAPKPLRAAAMGAALGLMLGLIVLIIRIQAWPLQRS